MDPDAKTLELPKAAFPQYTFPNPRARIKSIMKLDPDVTNVTLDGVYAVSVATVPTP